MRAMSTRGGRTAILHGMRRARVQFFALGVVVGALLVAARYELQLGKWRRKGLGRSARQPAAAAPPPSRVAT
jgi:hypothetical protein